MLATLHSTHDYRLLLGKWQKNHLSGHHRRLSFRNIFTESYRCATGLVGCPCQSSEHTSKHEWDSSEWTPGCPSQLDEIIVKPRVRIFAVPNQPAILIHTRKDAFIYTGTNTVSHRMKPPSSMSLRLLTRSWLFALPSCQLFQHRRNHLRQRCLRAASPSLLSRSRIDHSAKSRSHDQVGSIEKRDAERRHSWFSSLLSKSSNNDPYQPMINAFHAFLIRNDPVRLIPTSFHIKHILFRAVQSNCFDDFWIPLIRVNWTILSHSLEYSSWMIHLYSKVSRDLHSIDAHRWCLETNDLTRQLAKKIDIYNYYFAFLKLVGVWNKVRNRQVIQT